MNTKQGIAAWINQTVSAYLEAAVFADLPEDAPETNGFSIGALLVAYRDCADFLHQAEEKGLLFSDAFTEAGLESPTPSDIGQNLWLTRNSHGAGFWDMGWGDLGDAMSEIADRMGSVDLYVGDDNCLHLF